MKSVYTSVFFYVVSFRIVLVRTLCLSRKCRDNTVGKETEKVYDDNDWDYYLLKQCIGTLLIDPKGSFVYTGYCINRNV